VPKGDADERHRHLYIIGQTGTCKSTLLLNLLRQDFENGAGVALLDPHGDLARAVLEHIPVYSRCPLV
jgi:DNA helicase HerA-like ATPase